MNFTSVSCVKIEISYFYYINSIHLKIRRIKYTNIFDAQKLSWDYIRCTSYSLQTSTGTSYLHGFIWKCFENKNVWVQYSQCFSQKLHNQVTFHIPVTWTFIDI